MVEKDNGDIRIVFDLRKINEITVVQDYPMQKIEEILYQIGGARFFSKIDLNSGYYQVPMVEADMEIFAFQTPWKKYELTRMAQGARNSAATFQRLMNGVMKDLLGEIVLCYQNDLIVLSKTKEEHLKKLRTVFNRLRNANLKAKTSKCEFLKDNIVFLGHKVNSFGISPEEKNIEAIRDFTSPKNVKDIRSFLGVINYYRKFIPNCAGVTMPLTNLTKKAVKFNWTTECQEALERLKQSMILNPCLRHPDYTKNFYIYADASEHSIGAVLEQS